jgi:hypothetical protein
MDESLLKFCHGCDYYDRREGCKHPDIMKNEFMKIPTRECYSQDKRQGETYGE